ncbi:hypothetical protein ETA_08340 [Erwinia tasmaniensis Et1/99]|uniref:Uncharacterized protein n=1 Tax=Erwinia tasmaniensis (strain DSM 17950 / CFBP 7177 / CIP 109463 / NCPPB 4357 / Et1/99) TaxID=465817 RepID=B2VD24_ERWT9|nr:hypothetical protein ETA_08340 [Erwinia tasmaniensis Et1/99]
MATKPKTFLSCLCGSELMMRGLLAGHLFLSCLCGSEPLPCPAI